MNTKVAFLPCLWTCLWLLLSACSARESIPETANILNIGFAMDSLVVDRWQRDRDIFMARCQELGARVLLQTANEDHDTQVRQIGTLLDKGIDVLVVVPNDVRRIGATLQQCRDRGVPVISYDRRAMGTSSNLIISFDNRRVGELMAQALVDHTKGGTILVINGPRSDSNSFDLNAGFHKILAPMVAAGACTIAAETWLATWSNEEAYDWTHRMLNQGIMPVGVIAANDFLAEAVITALSERRILDKVSVVGHDGDLSACQRIVEGTQLMTVYKPVDQLARKAAEAAVALARTGTVSPVAGSVEAGGVVTITLQPVVVNRSNMQQEIIDPGIHARDAVYR